MSIYRGKQTRTKEGATGKKIGTFYSLHVLSLYSEKASGNIARKAVSRFLPMYVLYCLVIVYTMHVVLRTGRPRLQRVIELRFLLRNDLDAIL